MREFMIFGLILLIAVATTTAAYSAGYNYNPYQKDQSGDETYFPAVTDTEYFTYSSPDNYHDSKDIQRLSAIIRPQRVIFIKNPEKNIFSITAEQLAKQQQSLNIYVLNRQTDSAGLLSQLQEIRERANQKPNVQFVKYRTAEDIERVKQTIYNDFESIPGSSKYHEDHETPVYDFDSKAHQFYSTKAQIPSQEPPVIFEILRRSTPAPKVESFYEKTTQIPESEYLPPVAELGVSKYLPNPNLN